jgi:hypothetical protein
MAEIYCYSYVEDAPSAEVACKLVAERNASAAHRLLFFDGFPFVTGGCSALAKKCPAFLNMAKEGLYTLTLTDLDTRPCAGALIRQWFAIPAAQPIALPKEVVFRVAVREVESWIIADIDAWAAYIEIAAANFSGAPDTLPDPKQHLLNVVRKKGRKNYHKDMIPAGTASIGPGYNDVLCEFVREHWSPARASAQSPSLKRAIMALAKV